MDKTSNIYKLFKYNVDNSYDSSNALAMNHQLHAVDGETRLEMIKINHRYLRSLSPEDYTPEIIDYIVNNCDRGLSMLKDSLGEDKLTDSIITAAISFNAFQVADLSNPSDDLVKNAVRKLVAQRKKAGASQNDIEYTIKRFLSSLYCDKQTYVLSDELVKFFIDLFKDDWKILYYIIPHCNLKQLDALPDDLKLYLELNLENFIQDSNE